MRDETTAAPRATRNTELSLREELVATICGFSTNVPQVLGLAEHLVDDGWTKLAPGERVISAEEAQILAAAQTAFDRFQAWKEVRENRAESAEVSADASELTSDVKFRQDQAKILAAFAGADRPLHYNEAVSAAAGEKMPEFPGFRWDRWFRAFQALIDRKLIESLPAEEGEIRRYVLTQAGRGLHELDGVEG